MSDTINDGGQAFPTHPIIYSSADHHLAQGMSLRDWFAGQALVNVYTASETSPDKAAELAYQLADAMIAARSKGGAQ